LTHTTLETDENLVAPLPPACLPVFYYRHSPAFANHKLDLDVLGRSTMRSGGGIHLQVRDLNLPGHPVVFEGLVPCAQGFAMIERPKVTIRTYPNPMYSNSMHTIDIAVFGHFGRQLSIGEGADRALDTHQIVVGVVRLLTGCDGERASRYSTDADPYHAKLEVNSVTFTRRNNKIISFTPLTLADHAVLSKQAPVGPTAHWFSTDASLSEFGTPTYEFTGASRTTHVSVAALQKREHLLRERLATAAATPLA
jgi:hypothetical protein